MPLFTYLFIYLFILAQDSHNFVETLNFQRTSLKFAQSLIWKCKIKMLIPVFRLLHMSVSFPQKVAQKWMNAILQASY